MREAAERVSFVNQVSHELKTPLTNIRMYAELLEQKLPDGDQKATQHLGVIVSESQRLSRLIGNVLTFARKQNDKLTLHSTAGNVDQCIQLVLDHFKAALESKGVRTVFTPGADARVEFDRDALEQILGNLFSNVEKYAAAGGLLEVTSRQEARQTSIVVSDRGAGIPKGQEDRIFDPFHRLSNKLSDGVTGTGIGLSIARELARKHGGDLKAVASDVGARFLLELRTPFVEGVTDMKVLIAEDDPHTRAGLEEILEAEGYRSVRRKGRKGRLAVVPKGIAGLCLPRHHDARNERLRRVPGDPARRFERARHLHQCQVRGDRYGHRP